MKLLGLLCVVLACAGTGFLRARQLQAQYAALELLCALTQEMESCIRHVQPELGELLEMLAEHPNYRRFSFLCDTADSISPLHPFQETWAGALQADKAVPNNARAPLLQLGATLGTTDTQGQLAALQLCRAMLEQAAADARETAHTKGKLARALGLLGGAFAAVMLM